MGQIKDIKKKPEIIADILGRKVRPNVSALAQAKEAVGNRRTRRNKAKQELDVEKDKKRWKKRDHIAVNKHRHQRAKERQQERAHERAVKRRKDAEKARDRAEAQERGIFGIAKKRNDQ